MDIPSTAPLIQTPAPTRETPEGKGATANADFDSFLTLLTAQLRNQDPLQPMDATEFVAQLASFSSVEQLVQMNARLDGLAGRFDAQLGTGYASWIGQRASAVDGRFLASEDPEAFRVPPIAGAERVEAVVLAGEREIDRFAVTPDSRGRAEWTPSGAAETPQGQALRIELVYHGPSGVIDRRPAMVFRTIVGLRGTAGGPLLELSDGTTLAPGEVAELRTGGSGASSAAAG